MTSNVEQQTELSVIWCDMVLMWHHYRVATTLSGRWNDACVNGQNKVNTLRPRQDGRYFADDVLKYIFLNENVWISLKIPLKVVPRGPNNNIPALVQIMAWRRSGDKPLSEPMMVSLTTHICVTRPQWVNTLSTHFQSWGPCTLQPWVIMIPTLSSLPVTTKLASLRLSVFSVC